MNTKEKTKKRLIQFVSLALALLLILSVIALFVSRNNTEGFGGDAPYAEWKFAIPQELKEEYSISSNSTLPAFRHYSTKATIEDGMFAQTSFNQSLNQEQMNFVLQCQDLVEADGKKVELKLDLFSKAKWVDHPSDSNRKLLILLAPDDHNYYIIES